MRASAEIPLGETNAGKHVLELECIPEVGHYVGDLNGKLYRIDKIIHMIDTVTGDPRLKLVLSK